MNKTILVGIILLSIAVIGFTAGTLGLSSDVKITSVTEPTQKSADEPITISMTLDTKDLTQPSVSTSKTIDATITKQDYADCQTLFGKTEAECIKFLKENNTKFLAQQYVMEAGAVQEAKAKASRTAAYKDFNANNFVITQKDIEEQIVMITGTTTVAVSQ